jgi:hypothetical protein
MKLRPERPLMRYAVLWCLTAVLFVWCGACTTQAGSSPETALPASGTIVYVTETGKKYHDEDCSSLRKSKKEIALQEAIRLGYGACKLCDPPLQK